MYTHRNTLSRQQSFEKLQNETFRRKTVSFYRYVKISQPFEFRDQLFLKWQKLDVLGRIFIAKEGINAQLSIPQPNFEKLIQNLEFHRELKNMPLKIGLEEKNFSFLKLHIRIKKQIVADSLPEDSYDISNVGQHLSAEEFNRAMENKNSIVVDMRNHYESRIGYFENAIRPDVDTFREQLPLVKKHLAQHKNKKILLYCTGGVRCEKASAYLKSAGFKDVNQLYGGIISYTHEIKQKNLKSRFIGKNFVFDGRTDERITTDVLTECDQCDQKCDTYTNCANEICNLLFIQCPNCRAKMSGACCQKCRKIAIMPDKERHAYRKKHQPKHSPKIFKSRQRPQLKKPTPKSKNILLKRNPAAELVTHP